MISQLTWNQSPPKRCHPLETGQTYERKAIEEWMKRGNTNCPIPRQPLSANVLPKTNYVLKRLITSWKEQHPNLAHELSYHATPRSSYGSPSSRQIESTYTSSRTSNLYDDRNNSDDCYNYKPRRFMQAIVTTSPTSVISQAVVEAIISGLKPFISCLCTSEDLKECEELFWQLPGCGRSQMLILGSMLVYLPL
ncbi:hypothetical protein L6452_19391 [Arctium lappa]|uniref:Uncharacterized protein n=1 Tax=Arctium lappa TaxID=4217 RepID=A0ACB9B7W8_ARCLA|nr:hypothetical protein L6452_19391 [Arctium lappa]